MGKLDFMSIIVTVVAVVIGLYVYQAWIAPKTE